MNNLRDFYSFKQIYRKSTTNMIEIGFFDLKGKTLIVTILKNEVMLEAVYSALSYKEVKATIKSLVEKYTDKEIQGTTR